MDLTYSHKVSEGNRDNLVPLCPWSESSFLIYSRDGNRRLAAEAKLLDNPCSLFFSAKAGTFLILFYAAIAGEDQGQK